MPSPPSLVQNENQPAFKSESEGSVTSSKLDGKSLPSNVDAEQGLLAACILDSSG